MLKHSHYRGFFNLSMLITPVDSCKHSQEIMVKASNLSITEEIISRRYYYGPDNHGNTDYLLSVAMEFDIHDNEFSSLALPRKLSRKIKDSYNIKLMLRSIYNESDGIDTSIFIANTATLVNLQERKLSLNLVPDSNGICYELIYSKEKPLTIRRNML
jgi:hypothetical protein